MRRRLPPRRQALAFRLRLMLGGAAALAAVVLAAVLGPRFVAAKVAAAGDPAVRGAGASGPAEAGPQAAEHRVRRRLTTVGARALVLTGGVLIDGTGATPLQDAVVVVRGERIVAVGRAGEVGLPSPATVIDVRGATILPGVINAHVHSGYREERLEAWAHEGVTTVRCLAGPRDYARVAELGRNPSLARVVAAGPFVTVPGGYPIVPWGSTNAVTVTSPEEARAAVNQLVDEGADLIKIAIESGADFGRSIPTLSLAEARAIVETAHARGVPVSVHVTTSPDLPRALDAGVDDIAHMVVDTPSSQLIERVARESVVWVPTLELWYWVGYNHLPRASANLARFLAAGGTVALGTDFNGYDAPFQLGMPILEMELMQQAGMSPMQIIVAATRNAALVSNRFADLGTVEAGKLADLVVVEGDPLEDIHAMADVRLVVRSGVVIRSDGFE